MREHYMSGLFERSCAFAINPEPGMLLAFPAWLDHQVHPFFGRGEHISIAANVRVQNLRKEQTK